MKRVECASEEIYTWECPCGQVNQMDPGEHPNETRLVICEDCKTAYEPFTNE